MKSYLYIKVEGKNINNFLLKLKSNNINVLNVKYINNKTVLILINEYDYKKLLKIKSTNKIEVINSRGLIKFKELVLRYKITLFFFIFSIFILILLSNVIFSINVVTDNALLKKEIKNELSNYGIKKYSLKKSYDEIEKIKDKIKEGHKDKIEWIEISDYGTSYIVKIVERKINNDNIDNKSTNIVAKKSGVIRSIITESGETVAIEDSYISKGEIIISGSIIQNDEVKAYVKSKGKVYAETWYNVTVSYPLKYKEKKYTSNEKKTIYLKLSNNYYELFKYQHSKREDILSYKNSIIPLSFGIENITEVKIINKKYTLDEAKKLAINLAKEKVLEKLDEDAYIISEKTLKFSSNGSKIEMDVFISAYENIAKEIENVIVESEEIVE